MYQQTDAFVGCRIKLTYFILHPTTHLPVFEFLVDTTAGVRVYQPLLNELDSNPNVMLYIWYTQIPTKLCRLTLPAVYLIKILFFSACNLFDQRDSELNLV